MTLTRPVLAVAALATLLTTTACSSSGSGSATSSGAPAGSQSAASQPAGAAGAVITIKNFSFSGSLTVTPGEKVEVVDEDAAAHTLTAADASKFDTGNISGGGGKKTFTAPSAAGTYQFVCTYHANMKGTLVVKA